MLVTQWRFYTMALQIRSHKMRSGECQQKCSIDGCYNRIFSESADDGHEHVDVRQCQLLAANLPALTYLLEYIRIFTKTSNFLFYRIVFHNEFKMISISKWDIPLPGITFTRSQSIILHFNKDNITITYCRHI